MCGIKLFGNIVQSVSFHLIIKMLLKIKSLKPVHMQEGWRENMLSYLLQFQRKLNYLGRERDGRRDGKLKLCIVMQSLPLSLN